MKQYCLRGFQAGFTLIEIMVVIAILAILSATVIPMITDSPEKARIVRAKQDIGVLEQSLEMYKLDNFNYPSTDQGLQALIERPNGEPEAPNWKEGGYVKKLPNDPWGREYIYLSPGESGSFDILTYGRDGSEGGEGFDADISNWDSE